MTVRCLPDCPPTRARGSTMDVCGIRPRIFLSFSYAGLALRAGGRIALPGGRSAERGFAP